MRESTLWFLHFLAGAVIIIVLGIHFSIMHLDKLLVALGIGYSDVLSYESVLQRSRMMFHLVVYLVLLGAALYHGLYGFRSLVLELPLGKALEKVVSAVTLLGGLLLFIYGAYAIIVGYTV
jgi:succinate dehydrogenase hydrophobic anchor subunit